jgi:predicted unusual protein kinase regulating ubiquinone biosynthesis (AarF/ABC1/UbiB family)
LSYKESDIIGVGRVARVYKGYWRQQEVAIKVLREIPDAEQLIEFQVSYFLFVEIQHVEYPQKELEILREVRSANCVLFYG